MKADNIQYSEMGGFQRRFGQNGETDVSTYSRIRKTVPLTGVSYFRVGTHL